MNVVYKGLTKLKSIYNNLNPATLTGAIDIIVVEQPDGTLHASPFHVRFGKLGVLQPRERVVNISVNNEPVDDLQMKLGEQGEAFFVMEMDDDCPSKYITSPLPSRPSTPKKDEDFQVENEEELTNNNADENSSSKRKRRKKRKRKSQNLNELISSPLVVDWASSQSFRDDTNLQTSQNARTSSQSSSDSFINIPDREFRKVLSDSELQEKCGSFCPTDVAESSQRNMNWGWGQLPDENVRDSSGDEILAPEEVCPISTENNPDIAVVPCSDENDESSVQQVATSFEESTQDSTSYNENTHFRSLSSSVGDETHGVGEMNKSEKEQEEDLSSSSTKPSTVEKQQTNNSKQRNVSEGLYLDDVLSLDPSQADLYLKVKSTNGSVVNEVIERAASPLGSDVDSGTDCLNQEEVCESTDMRNETFELSASLCGFSTADSTLVEPGKFEEKLITYDTFLLDPMLYINDANLVFKINGKYYSYTNAQPMILSLALFKQPLPQECMESIERPQNNNQNAPAVPQPQQSSRIMNWLWRRPNKDKVSESESVNENNMEAPPPTPKCDEDEIAVIMDPTDLSSSHLEETILASNQLSTNVDQNTLEPAASTSKNMRKTTRLTSEQLARLDLKDGANTITFSVTSQYQGTKRCCAHIYKWKSHDKIVISDIDGTITKSDVFGQILPVVGKDWTQGGIAHLYQNISKNGYKFIYLSARAIGQASMTKDYLTWINQHGITLPPGPLLLSPTSLIMAFRREVIEKKPEKFKIACLKDIKELFPIGNPFYAGFGNKTSDVLSYTAVGIPDDRMFTINHRGELRQEKLPTYTTTLSDLGEVVDNFFPFIAPESSKIHTTVSFTQNFSDFSYWRNDLPSLSDEDLKLLSSN